MATVVLGPALLDLSGIRAGDRNMIELTISYKGTPLNLTGYTLTAQVRKTAPDPVIALTAVINVVNAAAGVITISFPGQAVSDLLTGQAAWDGVWDLQLASGAGDPLTIAAGKLQAVQDVTRP